MSSYQELQAQIAELSRRAEEAKQQELGTAIESIRKTMMTYGITMTDLEAAFRGRGPKQRTKIAAKYRDPKTGATWTGRGRVPLWLIGKDREDYLL